MLQDKTKKLMNFHLSPEASTALDYLSTYETKGFAINRAIGIAAYIEKQTSEGSSVIVRRPGQEDMLITFLKPIS